MTTQARRRRPWRRILLVMGIAHLVRVEQLAKLPFLGGNRVAPLIDGEQTFESLFAGIESAERYLLVQFYIVRADAVGMALQARLIEKARSVPGARAPGDKSQHSCVS